VVQGLRVADFTKRIAHERIAPADVADALRALGALG
jgi:hypothetical protein